MSAAAAVSMEVKASFERPIDLVHLTRQTLGNRSLEREILALFVRQSRQIIERLRRSGCPRERGDLAHTLKGSARAVGAWRVALGAEAVEAAGSDIAAQLDALESSVEEACHAIGRLDVLH
jgi:HPt (histidine-containing phosphotransfer) domain-containing protein